MDHLFDAWNEYKKYLQKNSPNINFHERDILWCSIGKNIGSEEDGKNELFERPVLVVKKFNNNLAWVLPLTTTIKDNPYYFILYKDSAVILSQLRVVSVKRFQRYMGKMSTYDFSLLLGKLLNLLK